MTGNNRLLFSLLSIIALWGLSCTKPVLIGADFLEDEKADLRFRVDFDLSFFTEKTDSLIVHSNNLSQQLATYLCGNIADPVFGKYSAEIYAQPVITTVASALRGATLDSVVLQLRYDTLGLYGNLEEPVTLEVYRMSENPSFNMTYYAHQRFMTTGELLGSKTFVPQPFDSVWLNKPTDTVRLAPHVRIPLDLSLLAEFTQQDSMVYTNQTAFLEYFNGLHIRMTTAQNTMLGFNLLNSLSSLVFYYDTDNIENLEFSLLFPTGTIKMVHMEHDYTGTPVAQALEEGAENDFWYVQGMSGATTRLEINNLSSLGNVLINRAELEFYGTYTDEEEQSFYPGCRYLVTQAKGDSTFVYSTDVVTALNYTSGSTGLAAYKLLFDGSAGEVVSGPPAVYKYTMKVTSQVREIYRGNKENAIYFNPFSKGDSPGRSVIFGPGHPQYAPRLKIHYTLLP